MQPPKLASIFLERSGDLPLNIYTLSDLCYEPAHLRRIKTLRLRTSGLDGLSQVFSRLTVPSPVITEVTIDVTGTTYEYFPHLPPLFGDTSTIRSLSLEGISFDTTLLRFTSLTSLNLYVPGALFPPFLDLLAANSALESISISAWGPITVEKVDGPTITLNNLATLHCRDVSKYLFSRLSPPRNAFIRIEDTGPPLSLSRSLPTSIANIPHLTQIDSLNLLTTTTNFAYSEQSRDLHKLTLAGCGGPVDIYWVLGYHGPVESDPQPLSLDCVKELSITHKTTLERPRASELDLFPLFNATKSLEVLKIHSCLPADCRSILSPFADTHMCLSLHTVEIVYCHGQSQWLSALLPIAAQRRDAGFALRQVIISPHPSVDSPTQKYIMELSSVLSNPTDTDTEC